MIIIITKIACNNLILLILMLMVLNNSSAQDDSIRFKEVASFSVPEARQGIAVDSQFFYVIDSKQIAKYEKETGKIIKKWIESGDGEIIHLNSGVIVEGKLICAHSNYPGIPMTSSVEIWDAQNLEHIDSHSFGIKWGSCTWIDWYQGFWWAAFAHYNKFEDINYTNNSYSTLVKFDKNWRAIEAWVYPRLLIERFDGMSNSGGSWGQDGYLYLTGHDRDEIYVVSLPSAGSVLVLKKILPIGIKGQGICWDRMQKSVLYTIRREDMQVVVFRLQDR
jgi:hypothetical protein